MVLLKGINHCWLLKDILKTLGIDFFETFYLVAWLNSIGMLASVVVNKDSPMSTRCQECVSLWGSN